MGDSIAQKVGRERRKERGYYGPKVTVKQRTRNKPTKEKRHTGKVSKIEAKGYKRKKQARGTKLWLEIVLTNEMHYK